MYGKQVASTYEGGLVDAESKEVFYKQLEDKKEQWDGIEKEHPGCVSGFYEWFYEHKCEEILCSMLRPIREDASLGVPCTSCQ